MRTLAIALLLWAGAAQAQTVVVRGGEHDEFTRLVLRIPDGAAWTLAPAPGGFEVGLPAGAVYDLGRAFDRIPRDRVEALRPLGEGRLALSVLCDCHAKAMPFRGVGLVIDIVDGPAPSGGLAPGRAAPLTLESGLPLVLDAPPVQSSFDRPTAPSAAALPDTVRSAMAEAERVAQTEAAILESVAAAATQGLLDVAPAQDLPEPPAVPPAEVPPAEVSPAVARSTEPAAADQAVAPPELPAGLLVNDPPAGSRPGVAFRTGSDTEGSDRAPLGATGTPCLPKESFNLAAWAGGGEFDVEVTARLAQLSDDRDRLDPEAVEALARTYLAFGFGREATAALDVDGRSSHARDELRLLARLMDGEAVPPGAFEDQAGCLGPVALWRALARESLQGMDERERAAMIIALRGLPPAVRGLIALRLAGLLLEDGDALGAQEVAALAEETGTEALLTRAEISRETEGPTPALRGLESLAETDGRMTPDGLVELIDLTIAQGQPVPDDTLELAQALRFEHGGDAARALLLAEIRALTADSRFTEALTLLAEERAAQPGEDLDAALAATTWTLTEELGDAAFLELALSDLPPDLPPEAGDAVARRLTALGFPDEGQTLQGSRAASGPAISSGFDDTYPGLNPTALTLREGPAGPSGPSAGAGGELEQDIVSTTRGSGSQWNPTPDWRQPPPLSEATPALPSLDGTARTAPAEAARAAPSPIQEASAAVATEANAPAAAGLEAVPETSELSEALTTLAARRALLEQAGAARDRAVALLDRSPIE